MADDITITAGDKSTFADGDQVKITSTGADALSGRKWLLNGVPVDGQSTTDHTFTMGYATDGVYQLTGKDKDGKAKASNELKLLRSTSDEAPSVFHPGFAVLGLLVVAVAAFFLYSVLQWLANPVFADEAWKELEGRLKVALVLGLPATVIGGALIVIGIWMAAVEWRGRLQDPPSKTAGGGRSRAAESQGLGGLTAEIINAVGALVGTVGNLKGSALVLIIGTLLMFGTLWVAQSAVSVASPESTSAPASPAPGSEAPGSEAPSSASPAP